MESNKKLQSDLSLNFSERKGKWGKKCMKVRTDELVDVSSSNSDSLRFLTQWVKQL